MYVKRLQTQLIANEMRQLALQQVATHVSTVDTELTAAPVEPRVGVFIFAPELPHLKPSNSRGSHEPARRAI